MNLKQDVYEFWNQAACGENLYLSNETKEAYERQASMRYSLEPYILDFAEFALAKNKRVLEIGVGLGADHQRFAEAGADLYGIDLTERAVEHTRKRLQAFGLNSSLEVGDAEHLSFPGEFFDMVYSWGVLHHTPDTNKAIDEVYRVLRDNGVAKIMIYHKWSMVGLMLWMRYALFAGKPWRTLSDIYSQHLESPGTKAYTKQEAAKLFSAFKDVNIKIILTHGDLLTSQAGQRHQGVLLNLARKVWPRRIIKAFFPHMGLFMLIEARK